MELLIKQALERRTRKERIQYEESYHTHTHPKSRSYYPRVLAQKSISDPTTPLNSAINLIQLLSRA